MYLYLDCILVVRQPDDGDKGYW